MLTRRAFLVALACAPVAAKVAAVASPCRDAAPRIWWDVGRPRDLTGHMVAFQTPDGKGTYTAIIDGRHVTLRGLYRNWERHK